MNPVSPFSERRSAQLRGPGPMIYVTHVYHLPRADSQLTGTVLWNRTRTTVKKMRPMAAPLAKPRQTVSTPMPRSRTVFDVASPIRFGRSHTAGFGAGERDEFAFVEDDAFGAAQQLPPFPGAAGGDQENEGDKYEC